MVKAKLKADPKADKFRRALVVLSIESEYLAIDFKIVRFGFI